MRDKAYAFGEQVKKAKIVHTFDTQKPRNADALLSAQPRQANGPRVHHSHHTRDELSLRHQPAEGVSAVSNQ